MEFEDMKKIWDEQNNEPLYAINEEALHRSIKAKKEKAARLTNINDIGLIAIGIITAIIYSLLSIVNKTPTIYDYLTVAAMLVIAGYIWFRRVRRKRQGQTYARTMLGDLDHAIANVTYEANRSKNMVWWYILPLAILVMLNLMLGQRDVSIWTWVVVAAAFVLSALLVRWDYNRCQKPRLQKLVALRKKLTEETEAESL